MKTRVTSLVILIFLLCVSSWGGAQTICPIDGNVPRPKEVSSLQSFQRLPVLDGGRIKPMDSYARNILLRFSGRRNFQRRPAIEWFARFLFAPEATRPDKIFLINHQQIPQALGIEVDKKRRYSFEQLEKGYPKLVELAQAAMMIEEKERNLVENEIVRVFEKLNLYAQLSRSFVFAFPHPDFAINSADNLKAMNFSGKQNVFSFIDIALRADLLHRHTKHLETKSQETWTENDHELARVLANLFQWSMSYQHLPLAIVPSYTEEGEQWLSPWDAVAAGLSTEPGNQELSRLRDMTAAYWYGQQLEFDIAARAFHDLTKKRAATLNKHVMKNIDLEIQINRVMPFLWAKVFYFMSFLIFLFSLISEKKIYYRLTLVFITLGFLPHFSGIISRIVILQRPPVSTLYETFLFVALMSVVLGFLIERANRQWLGIVVASVCGFLFLFIASKFNTDGDSLQMLVAVLNSNFWLSTHVLSITTGYAGCCVAGIVGHIYILQALLKPGDKKRLENTYRNLIGILGFGLIMTFLGTNLGGIWADQSWGRFWGWDPKENGALLIILWTAILFHAKIARLIGPLGLAVGSALGIIIVMWAWFGVNLLSVGLHSYGFTSGVATGLLVYVVCQILFLGAAFILIKKRSTI